MNKNELIAKIRGLEGLDTEEKSALIGLLNEHKKYGLVWEEKPEDCEKNLVNELPVLCEVPERFVGASAPASAPNHILIEGDNYHALTALQYTHAGKVDVIYIDPPYNRGKTDFKYNDDYIDKDDAWKHSLWSSFIYKRLCLAKKLLSPSGVIIVHIDENEYSALQLILDEVFVEKNRLGTIVWNKRNPKGDPKEVSTMHESILVYAKNKDEFKLIETSLVRKKPNAEAMLAKAKRLFSKIGKTQVPEEIKQIIKPFGFTDEMLKKFEVAYNLEMVNKEYQSWLSRQDFSGGELAYKMIDNQGRVYQSVSMAWPNKEEAPADYWIPLIHPTTGKECVIPSRGWRNPPKTMERLLEQELVLFGLDETTQPRRKYLLEENLFENVPSIYDYAGSDDELLADLRVEFEYPKPVDVAKYLLNSIIPKAETILDFFAGSGTTLHATMALNADDGGQRQCILVTNNEIKKEIQKQMLADGIVKGSPEWEAKGICQAVTYERNKRVIEGYTNAKGEVVAGLGNNKLRYFKVGFVPAEPTLANLKALVKASVGLLCVKEDAYEAVQIPAAYDTGSLRAFRARYGVLLLIEDEDSILNGIEWIADSDERFKVYVFSANHYAHDAEFEEELSPEDLARIELCALPDAILRAYQSVIRAARSRSHGSIDEEGSESEVQTEEVEA